MRLVAPMLFAPYAMLAASLFAALKSRPDKPSVAPARAPAYNPPQRVRVALQAAARARR